MHPSVLLIVICLVGVAMVESKGRSIPEPAIAAAAIRQLNQEYIDAARTGDAAWFSRYLADDVLVISGFGRRLNKTEFLAQFDASSAFKSLSGRNVTVRVFGPTVQVAGDAPWELSDGHQGESRYIDTYAWLDNRWQVISAQITWLSDQPSGK